MSKTQPPIPLIATPNNAKRVVQQLLNQYKTRSAVANHLGVQASYITYALHYDGTNRKPGQPLIDALIEEGLLYKYQRPKRLCVNIPSERKPHILQKLEKLGYQGTNAVTRFFMDSLQQQETTS